MQTLAALFSDSSTERELLEGSHFYGANFAIWQAQRRLIAEALPQPGTLLDIGCANGLLLQCLLEWSPHRIVPYGIDPDQGRLEQAQTLLPEYASHFAPISLGQMDQLLALGLPHQFDFVYWNVWDDFNFDHDLARPYLDGALKATRKRLLLGFYGPSLEAIEKKIDWLEGKLGLAAGQTENTTDCVKVVWWDQATSK